MSSMLQITLCPSGTVAQPTGKGTKLERSRRLTAVIDEIVRRRTPPDSWANCSFRFPCQVNRSSSGGRLVLLVQS